MSNLNDSLQEETSTLQRTQNIAKQTLLIFLKSGITITALVIAFSWANDNMMVSDRLSKVDTEVWVGLAATGLSTYWGWYSERERERLKLAQENALVNSVAIKAVSESFETLVRRLEGRIDSIMLQIADLRNKEAEITDKVVALNITGRSLNEKIDQCRYDVLHERLEIIKSFYGEICEIHAAVSYLKGAKETTSDRPVALDALIEKLKEEKLFFQDRE